MIYEDSAEDKLWKTIDPRRHLDPGQINTGSRKLGYNCGPGIDVPTLDGIL